MSEACFCKAGGRLSSRTMDKRTKAGEESCSSNDFERLDNGALSAAPPRF